MQAPPAPTFSPNARWMAIRRQFPTDRSWSIEVMHPDGWAHRSVPLAFSVASGGLNPWISDDGTQLVSASGGCVESQRHNWPDALTYYRVDVASGKATTIASLPHTTHPANGMITNDGRSLAYLHNVETRVDFYEFDFSELLKVAGR